MRDPRTPFPKIPAVAYKPSLEEVRLQYAREVFLNAVRAGQSVNYITWEQCKWAAEQGFPE